jgi:hypothetical protein
MSTRLHSAVPRVMQAVALLLQTCACLQVYKDCSWRSSVAAAGYHPAAGSNRPALACKCAIGLEQCTIHCDHLMVICAVAEVARLFQVVHHECVPAGITKHTAVRSSSIPTLLICWLQQAMCSLFSQEYHFHLATPTRGITNPADT